MESTKRTCRDNECESFLFTHVTHGKVALLPVYSQIAGLTIVMKMALLCQTKHDFPSKN